MCAMDMQLETILKILKQEKDDAVNTLLKAPRVSHGLGDFRYLVGLAAGLDRAVEIINQISNNEEEGDADERE